MSEVRGMSGRGIQHKEELSECMRFFCYRCNHYAHNDDVLSFRVSTMSVF